MVFCDSSLSGWSQSSWDSSVRCLTFLMWTPMMVWPSQRKGVPYLGNGPVTDWRKKQAQFFFLWLCFYELFNWALSLPLFNCTLREVQTVGIKNPLEDKAVDNSYHQSRLSHWYDKKHCTGIACWQNYTLKGEYLQAILDSRKATMYNAQEWGKCWTEGRRISCEMVSSLQWHLSKIHSDFLSFPMMGVLSPGKPCPLPGLSINW